MLVALPGCLILLAGSMYLWQVKLAVEESLPAVIHDYARQQADLEVRVARARLSLREVQLWNLDIRLPDGNRLLESRYLRVAYPLGGQPLNLTIERPQVWLQRNAQGQWNIEPLLKRPPHEEPTQLNFRLRISDGVLHFEDLYPTTPVRETIVIRSLSMVQPLQSASLKAQGQSDSLGEFTVEALSDGKRWWVEAVVPQMRAERLQAYLPTREIRARTIRSALTLQIIYEPQKPLWLLGYAEGTAHGITFRQKLLPYAAVRFSLHFTESWLAGRLQAGGRDQLTLSGKVDWASSPVRIAGQLAMQGNNPQDLWRLFRDDTPPVKGDYSVWARFGNTLESPQILAQVQLAQIETARGAVKQIQLPLLIIKDHQIWVPAIEVRYAQRPLHARIYADLRHKDPTFRLDAHVKDFPINLVDELKDYPLSGTLEAHLMGWGSFANPRLEMNLTSDRLLYNQHSLGTLRARLRYVDGRLTLPISVVQGALGTVQLTGELTLAEKPRLNLALNAHELDLNLIARMLGYSEGALIDGKPLDGIGYATLQIRGLAEAPEAIAEFAVFDGRLGDISAEITAGTLTYADRQILIPEVRILRRSAQIVASGVVRLPEKPREEPTFELSANATDLDIDMVSDWTRTDLPLSGVASVSLIAKGTPQQFWVNGSVNSRKTQVDRLIVQQAQASFSYLQSPQERRLEIQEAQASLGEGRIAASGLWQSDGTVQLNWHLDTLPLKEVAPYLPAGYSLLGTLSARGQVSGTLETPEAKIELWTTPLQLNRVAVGTLEGFAIWHASQSLQGKLRLDLPEGEILLSDLHYHPESRQILGSVQVINLPLTWVHTLARALPIELPAELLTHTENLSGSVNLALQLAGTTKTPTLAFEAQLNDLNWNEQSLGTLALKGTWQGERSDTLSTREARLESLRWSAENARLEGSAMWTPENLQADLEINQFPLKWVRLWNPSLPEIEGSVDVSLLGSGRPESPSLMLSATLQNLEYMGYRVDQVLFSQIDVAEGRIETADALLRVKDYQARLSGNLPFHWCPFGISRTEPLAVEIQLIDQPLRLLELLAPIDPQRTEGILNAQLRIEGTLENLQPRGTLTVRNGAVGLEPFQTALAPIGLQVEFDDTQARIVQAHAQSSHGGTLSLTGSVDFTGETPSLNLSGNLNGFTIKEPKLPFGGSAEGTINGNWSLTGKPKQPALQAQISVPRGTLNLPAAFTVAENTQPLGINPSFDVRVQVGGGFNLRNPNLDAQLEGELNLTGTLQAVAMDGTFRMRTGVLKLPTARLRIEPDSLVTVNYPYTLPTGEVIARINLDVRATTSVVAADWTGDPVRYRVEVDVRGPLDDPERLLLSARSEPPGLSEQRIFTLLGRGAAISALARGDDPSKVFREQLSDILTAQVLPALFTSLESQLAEAFDLEQFAVDYSGLRPASVYLVKNLFDGFGISYRRSLMLGNQAMYEVRLFYRPPFRYRLLQRMRIGVGFDQTQTRFLFVEGTLLFR